MLPRPRTSSGPVLRLFLACRPGRPSRAVGARGAIFAACAGGSVCGRCRLGRITGLPAGRGVAALGCDGITNGLGQSVALDALWMGWGGSTEGRKWNEAASEAPSVLGTMQ